MKLSFALISALVLCPALAGAQVTVNHAALLQLAGISIPPPVKEQAAPAEPKRVVHYHRRIVHRSPAAFVPLPAKPLPVVARVAPPPLPPAPKPVAPAVLNFAPGSAALPGNAAAMLAPFCKAKAATGIEARAPGDASDPSAAMRLSLSRAMAVHDALVACGVPASSIIPRAVGTVPGQDENEAVLGVMTK